MRLLDLRLHYKATAIKTLWYWHRNRNISKEQERRARNKPRHLWKLIYDKGGKNIQRKHVSSINTAGKTGQLHAKKMKLEHSRTPYMKINSKCIKFKSRYYKTPKGKNRWNTLT